MNTQNSPTRDLVPRWMREVSQEQLPEVYQEMAEVIGVEPTMRLAQVFSGNSVYFPKLDRSLLELRNQAIRRDFNGANIKELARRWGLSARHVRHIVNPPRHA
ncbi:Mor transcription activator domain protein [Desulfarculus baarsii DSM 2075]|uniref:Mor transcription activator domain protein n=1 Tax=Desulfarculus baarsii (strain ATCC 33931 / DSM 2075 / LMG 7858 / VKM B-1802 / 2st14) TaxID=644282 RepID=E1QM43_DESB2|nr:Mor transcription activator family protein [Desulfarculus baarsii]ADK86628.1 Mor transcription activator domain protein [Desulfarculus baarsii DSM 2075]